MAQALTGEGPDLIVGAHDWTGELVSNGLISSIELGDKRASWPTTPSPASARRRSVRRPHVVENTALVRNNKILQDYPGHVRRPDRAGCGAGAEFPAIIDRKRGLSLLFSLPSEISNKAN